MTEPFEPNRPYYQPAQPQPKKKAWWKNLAVITAAGGLLLGAGMGAAAAKPDTVEVEKRVEVPGPERTVTKTVEKPVASPACTKYVDLSEQAFSYAAEAMGYMSDAMKSTAKLDASGIYAAKDKLEAVNPKMDALSTPMNAAKAECRAAK